MFRRDISRAHWECIHFGGSGDAATFRELSLTSGLLLGEASLAGVSDSRGFIGRVAQALPFPVTFWASWDGLSDGLCDLRNRVDQRGLALVLSEARGWWSADPEGTGIFIASWLNAARQWGGDMREDLDRPGRPFHLFVEW